MVNQNSPKLPKFTAAGSTTVAPKQQSKSAAGHLVQNQRVDSLDTKVDSAAPRFAFTKKALDALAPPAKKRVYCYDERESGLLLTVYPTGRKTFSLYRKVSGRPDRITIGGFPDLTIEQARSRAQELKGAIARGQNPSRERAAIRDEMTLGELFENYLENHARRHKRTWRADVAMFRLYFDGLRLRKISSITKSELVALHVRLGKRGHYAANRAMELMSSMFSRAKEWGWTGENPASGIKAFRERRRQRFLDADELPAFFESLAKERNGTVRDFILSSLLTGARQSNVASMSWPEIRWGRGIWEIPAEKSKSGEAMDVMLTPPMLELLERRKADPGAHAMWVFPGVGKTGHLVELKSAWARILKRAGITDCRLHDLRRTLGSWQALQGASLVVIGASLGHRSLQATQVYARLNADPVKLSVLRATDALLAAGRPPEGLLPVLPGKPGGGNG